MPGTRPGHPHPAEAWFTSRRRAELEDIVEGAAEPKRLIFIPGADHFFGGQLEPMQATLAGWLKEQLL